MRTLLRACDRTVQIRGFGFVDKSFLSFFIAHKTFRQESQGDYPIQPRILTLVDHTHPPHLSSPESYSAKWSCQSFRPQAKFPMIFYERMTNCQPKTSRQVSILTTNHSPLRKKDQAGGSESLICVGYWFPAIN